MLTVTHGGEVVAQVPARSLTDDGPEYDRPMQRPASSSADDPTFVPFEKDLRDALLTVLSSPNVASKRWVFEHRKIISPQNGWLPV